MNLVNFDAAMLIPLIPVLVLAVLLIGWSLIDIGRRPVQHLPKWAWALIVLLAIPLGAVVYLIIGRTRGQKLRDEDLR
ncbi:MULTISPECIES: PLD nuclease N-terminal domain-containing protein [Micrococcales]|uniref:Cardiolipin synthase N-terminal domain-containing protein n=2 Tax=Micrococcales TaxID=85006 RepID=A0A449D9L6_9MICO|nr:PLD nuclease N-terminal domain-containing protein [Brevibacterium casei]MBP2407787.1 hypothetical protein [Brachybacterium fresconis]VEW14250.1 Uncharacterised protein [Brevibacterium casei]